MPPTLALTIDTTSVQEMLFSNINDAVTITVDAKTLVGNTDATGPADSIAVVYPLMLVGPEQQLAIDTSALLAEVYAMLRTLQSTVASVEQQLY